MTLENSKNLIFLLLFCFKITLNFPIIFKLSFLTKKSILSLQFYKACQICFFLTISFENNLKKLKIAFDFSACHPFALDEVLCCKFWVVKKVA